MKLLLALMLLSSSVFASDWAPEVGIGMSYYSRPQSGIWNDANQPQWNQRENYSLALEADRQLDNGRVKIGAYIPQVQHFLGLVTADACQGNVQQCGVPGTMYVDTRQRGIYALWSPEHHGAFLDIGAWAFRQEVTMWASSIPSGAGVAPKQSFMLHSVVYRVNPVVGFGYRANGWEVALDFFDCHPRDGSAQPPGFNNIVEVLNVKREL